MLGLVISLSPHWPVLSDVLVAPSMGALLLFPAKNLLGCANRREVTVVFEPPSNVMAKNGG